MLGAGPGDADGVGFLEAVGADHEGRNLARQDDQRDRIQQRIRQSGHGIRGPRTRRDQHDTRLARGPGIAFGHVDRALFVTDQNMGNVVLLENLVIDG